MRRAELVIVVLLASYGASHSQIHIRESVTIFPTKPKQIGLVTHSLRFVFRWDTHSLSRLYVPVSPCGGIVEDNPRYGTDSIEIDVPLGYPGQYSFDPQVGVGRVPYGQPVHATFSIYVDSAMVYQESATLAGSELEVYSVWPNGWINYSPPWKSGFNFDLDPERIPYSTDSHPEITGYSDCSGGCWSSSDDMTLKIISGGGYASFYSLDLSSGAYDIACGAEVKGTGEEIDRNIILSSNGAVPGPDGEWVVVGASSGGMEKIDSVLITPPPELDHFEVTTDPSEIIYLDKSTIRVQAKDADGEDFFLDGAVRISADPPGYGELTYFNPGNAGKVNDKVGGVHTRSVESLNSRGAEGHLSDDESVVVPYNAANSGNVHFTADGTKPAEDVTITFTVSSVDEPSKVGTGSLVIKAKLPELVVIYPTDELKAQKDITAKPLMPAIKARAKLENYKGGTVNFQWNLHVQWEGGDERQFNSSFPGNTDAENSEESEWTVDWNRMIRGGDEITLDVTATAGGNVYDKTVEHPFLITGINPSKDEIKALLTIEEQVIAYMESHPKWHHFIKDHDYPVFGAPHGYGLMQLDTPRPTAEQVWNWRDNLSEGRNRFAEKSASASSYPADVRKKGGAYRFAKDYSQDEYLTDAFQLYNGFHYWIWTPFVAATPSLGGHWIKDPNLGRPKSEGGHGRDYGGPAMQIYNEVKNGTPPAGW